MNALRLIQRSHRLVTVCSLRRELSSSTVKRQSNQSESNQQPTDQPEPNIVKDFIYPEHFEFYSQKYRTDDWTNLTNNIIRRLNAPDKLYQLNNNPIHLISEGIKQHFVDYDHFEFRNPIVTIESNFDSLLIPKDHVSRSKSDCYYVNKDLLLRAHSSAHQLNCLKDHGSKRFVCIADVYRRDVIDSTHFPVFHQCEIFNVLDQVNFSCVLHSVLKL